MSRPAPLVEWRAVGLVYPGEVPVVGLHPTDLRLETGSYVAVEGPSGSGKSTLLSLLGLLSPPGSGTFLLDGVEVDSLTDDDRARLRAESIGFVFQGYHLVASLTAAENVALRLMYQGIPRREAGPLAAEALDRVGLADRRHHRPSQLSGGQCQRVAIARSMVGRPGCCWPTSRPGTSTPRRPTRCWP